MMHCAGRLTSCCSCSATPAGGSHDDNDDDDDDDDEQQSSPCSVNQHVCALEDAANGVNDGQVC